MATPTTRDDLLELLRKSGVLKPDTLEKYFADTPSPSDEPKTIVSRMVQAKLLTQFQAKLFLAGRYKGFRLGPYILLEQLGQGGMGAVYLAEHETLHRKAAIKVLPPGGDKITVERFLREARAVAALDHPNIVRMHDVGLEGEVHYLAMEYVEGQTLDKLVTPTAPLPAQRAVEYIAQACAGLQHAFERGFIHRDIKPSNLILAKDGTVKILDMGLARSNEKSDQLTEALDAGAIVGTADYISPEQAMNEPGVDIRADIYSLGATFFAIVTGRPPFDGHTASKLVQHQVKDPPSVTSLDRTFPEGLSAVISKMMAKRPSDRYSTPAEVIEALQPWQNESAILTAGLSQTLAGQSGILGRITGKLGEAPPPKKKSRSPMFAILGGVAAALVLGIGIAVAIALSGGSRTETKTTVAPPDPIPIPTGLPYAFDAGSIPEFRVVKEKSKVVEGTDGKFPPGIYVHAYKLGARGEFRRELFAGKPVIALENPAAPGCAQIVFDLEGKLRLPLTPEKRYMATLEYAMTGSGSGLFSASEPAPDFARPGEVKLTPTDGGFARKSFSFVRTPGIPLRLAVDVASIGRENALYISRVDLVEDAPTAPRVLCKLELGDGKAVTVTRITKSGTAPDSKISKVTSRIGEGQIPDGWYGRSNVVDAECEIEIAVKDGQPAIGLRTTKLPDDAKPGGFGILFGPKFDCPTGMAKLKFEYFIATKSDHCGAKYRPIGMASIDLGRFVTPTAEWTAVEYRLETTDHRAATIEILNGADIGETLWIRNLVITEVTPDDLKKK